MDTVQYVRRETAVSIVISAALTALMFFVVFSGIDPVRIWAPGGWIADFLPQSFMIALMCTLVPGLLTRQRIRFGAVATLTGATRLPRGLLARSLLLAVAAALLGTGLMAAIAVAAQQPSLDFAAALTFKVIYGAALAAVITPIGLRAALTCP